MALSGFLQGLGQQAGYIIDYKQQYDAKQQQLESGKQQLQMNAFNMQLQQQQLATKAEIGQDLSAQFKADATAAGDMDKTTAIYQKEFSKLMTEGKLDDASRMMQMANQTEAASRQKKADVLEQHKQLQEATATAALNYADNHTPEGAAALEKAYAASGGDPNLIPKPNTPGYSAWATGQATSSMTAAQKAAFVQKEADLKAARDEKSAEAKARLEEQRNRDKEMAAYRQLTAQMRLADQAARAEALKAAADTRHDAAAFRETGVLNAQMQAVAKPILADRANLELVRALLAQDNTYSDQQVRQILGGMYKGVKGLGTNKGYDDNKTFGDVSGRIEGFLSKQLSGKFRDDDRIGLRRMVEETERTLIDPQLQKLEDNQRAHAKQYGLNPEAIMIQGDFQRAKPQVAAAPAGTSAKPTPPSPGKPPAGAKPFGPPGVYLLPSGHKFMDGVEYREKEKGSGLWIPVMK
jgi:hypothetical protein